MTIKKCENSQEHVAYQAYKLAKEHSSQIDKLQKLRELILNFETDLQNKERSEFYSLRIIHDQLRYKYNVIIFSYISLVMNLK